MKATTKRKLLAYAIPVGLGAIIIAVMAFIMSNDANKLMKRDTDQPPVIDFTWTPAGEVTLIELKGLLKISDDYGLDFTTYRMKLIEAERELDMPIPGLVGKEYEQPVSFSLIAFDEKLAGKTKLTVEVTIADDKGQFTTLTKVIPIKPVPANYEIK